MEIKFFSSVYLVGGTFSPKEKKMSTNLLILNLLVVVQFLFVSKVQESDNFCVSICANKCWNTINV